MALILSHTYLWLLVVWLISVVIYAVNDQYTILCSQNIQITNIITKWERKSNILRNPVAKVGAMMLCMACRMTHCPIIL